MAHQLFVKFITFLTDGEVSNHSGKSRSNSTVQSGNTTATGDGIATRHFIQNSFTVKSTNMILNIKD